MRRHTFKDNPAVRIYSTVFHSAVAVRVLATNLVIPSVLEMLPERVRGTVFREVYGY